MESGKKGESKGRGEGERIMKWYCHNRVNPEAKTSFSPWQAVAKFFKSHEDFSDAVKKDVNSG